MSQHIIVDEATNTKYVFGWDQPLQSFYLQVHNTSLPEDDDRRISVWRGATPNTIMEEVDELVGIARVYGCKIPYETQVKLYGEKDDGL